MLDADDREESDEVLAKAGNVTSTGEWPASPTQTRRPALRGRLLTLPKTVDTEEILLTPIVDSAVLPSEVVSDWVEALGWNQKPRGCGR